MSTLGIWETLLKALTSKLFPNTTVTMTQYALLGRRLNQPEGQIHKKTQTKKEDEEKRKKRMEITPKTWKIR